MTSTRRAVAKTPVVLPLLLLSVVLLAETSCWVSADPDSSVLNAIFNSTNGLLWHQSYGWTTTTSTCDWYGVSCSQGIYGNSLDLSKNNLVGTLPPLVSSRDYLDMSYVNFDENQLSGTIPALDSSINSFYAANNQLTGNLENLVNVAWIDVSNNQLSGTLPVFVDNLHSVDLSNNQLSGTIPYSLNKVIYYETRINLSGNQFTAIGMPEPVTGAYIDLSNNPFKCPIPQWAINRAKATCT
eukprot:TRINITY_DN501_c0_g1_i1.p1 TRINITY_DN501_c0_g1~~TRINITY_DN501_c0_g1_i1.p1  ORF type:complete len:241 (-),score=45.97 TRINITY_DN501_c0_g1_i1:90-812(-)